MAQVGLVIVGVAKVSEPGCRMSAKHVGLLLLVVHMVNMGSVSEVVFPSGLAGVVADTAGDKTVSMLQGLGPYCL